MKLGCEGNLWRAFFQEMWVDLEKTIMLVRVEFVGD